MRTLFLVFGDSFPDFLYAVFRTGMSAHKLWLALPTARGFQNFHDLNQGFRVVARLDHKTDAEVIGFQFLVATVGHIDQPGDHLCGLCGIVIS